MDNISINCVIGETRCDVTAAQIECSGHRGPCFDLIRNQVILATICKTVEGKYIPIIQTELTQDDIDGIGEQIDGELSSF